MSLAQLSDLIGAIYDCAVDPARWVVTLGTIRKLLDAENAALSLIDLRTSTFLLNFLDNVPPAWREGIDRWGADIIKAWGGVDLFRAMPLDVPFIWSRAIKRLPAMSNPFVEEVTSKGIGDSISLVLARDADVVGACGFGRLRSKGPFTPDQIELADLLRPHLQRAIAISRLLDLATLRASALEAALDALNVPAILVTDRLGLVYANPVAEAELADGQLLRVSDGRVVAADLRNNRQLRAAIQTAHTEPEGDPGKLDVRFGDKSPALTLLPLPAGSARGLLSPAAAAVIVYGPAQFTRRPPDQAIASFLGERFALTKAESSVALEIAKGDGRAAAAGRLGISEKTVRTHLSAIFLKTGTNRQSQLIRLIEDGLENVPIGTESAKVS